MKYVKLILLAVLGYGAFVLFTSPNTACTKKNYIYDTTIKKDTTIIRDTLVRRDTVVRKDTVYDLTSGLIAYFNFNGGSLHDSSGLHNDIYFNNATMTADRFGRANNAYLFNGTSSYMKVHNNLSLSPNNITLMATVKLNAFYTGPCSGNQIFMKGPQDPSNGVYGLRVNFFGANCSVATDTSQERATGLYGDNSVGGIADLTSFVRTQQWVTLVYTYDGIQAKLYVNGQLKTATNVAAPLTANSNDLYIGATENAADPYWFNGVIDEIRIYNKALSAAAVTQLSKNSN